LRIRKVDPDEYHRSAAQTLGELGLAARVPSVERLARDTRLHDSVRTPILVSLSHIADRRMIPILIDLLDDPSQPVAATAWQQLMLATGSPLDRGRVEFGDEASEFRQKLSSRWRRFWAENGDLIRPRRAPTFQGWGGGF
jgi:hypothetical protein